MKTIEFREFISDDQGNAEYWAKSTKDNPKARLYSILHKRPIFLPMDVGDWSMHGSPPDVEFMVYRKIYVVEILHNMTHFESFMNATAGILLRAIEGYTGGPNTFILKPIIVPFSGNCYHRPYHYQDMTFYLSYFGHDTFTLSAKVVKLP